MINYTSPRLCKSNHMIAADLGTRGWSTGGFFFLHLLFGGGVVMIVGVAMRLARKTGELGGGSFIQMAPMEIRTYSLSSNLIPSSTRITHTLQNVPEVVN